MDRYRGVLGLAFMGLLLAVTPVMAQESRTAPVIQGVDDRDDGGWLIVVGERPGRVVAGPYRTRKECERELRERRERVGHDGDGDRDDRGHWRCVIRRDFRAEDGRGDDSWLRGSIHL